MTNFTPDAWTDGFAKSEEKREEMYLKSIDEANPLLVPYNRLLIPNLQTKLQMMASNDKEVEGFVKIIFPDIPFNQFVPTQPSIDRVLHMDMRPDVIQTDEGHGPGVRFGLRYVYSDGNVHYVIDTIYKFFQVTYTLFDSSTEMKVKMNFGTFKYENNQAYCYHHETQSWDDMTMVEKRKQEYRHTKENPIL
jgi:hypothetical protein